MAKKKEAFVFLLLLLLLFAPKAFPQAASGSEPLTVAQVVATALRQYPALHVSQAEARQAASGIAAARTAYLPKLDVIGGVNRASRNNVLGLLLPSQVIAPITGPVLGTNGLDSAWGSTVGVLASWEPFDFGLRRANVAVAEAGRARADAAVVRTQLEIATLAADSALTLLAATQTEIAANAAVARAGELQRITEALVKAELRPGAESSLAKAEQAAAQAQLLRAHQAVSQARIALAALLGEDANTVAVAEGKLLSLPPLSPPAASVTAHPTAREQNAVIGESNALLRAIDRSYFPRFSIQGTSYARGTGALPDGRLLGGANGLGPNVQNWGVGFTADFSLLQSFSLRARRESESARLDAEKGRYEKTLVDLTSRRDQALAAYEGARQIAQTTPVAVEAAQAAVEQSRARYQSGLGAALDVAEAQRRLAQAEIDDRLARLIAWRERLTVYAAEGDITPLLNEANQ